jgi:hypothetical protein
MQCRYDSDRDWKYKIRVTGSAKIIWLQHY